MESRVCATTRKKTNPYYRFATSHALDRFSDEQRDSFSIGDMLAAEIEDPSVTASRDIDWQEFGDQLSNRERIVLSGLAAGHGTGELAKQCGVSAPRICQIKEEIAEEISERWGEDVLQEVDREPMWRSSLRAKERCVV